MPAAPSNDSAVLSQLVAGQAKAQQQFEELFRRLDRAEETAGEARDTAKELVTILREQDTGTRITEMRSDFRAGMAEIRQDFVAANTRLRQDLETEVRSRKDCTEELAGRLELLEAERNKVIGVASFFGWLSKVAPWLLAGIAAFAAGIGLKDG